MDSVAQTPELRQCDSKDQCLQVAKYPDGIMPVTEFYKARPNRCKKCHQEKHTPYRNEAKTKANKDGHKAEEMAIEKLRSMGIYAILGRDCKQFKHTDIVINGCIRVECKAGHLEHSECKWSFSSQKTNGGFKADLILLIMYIKDEPSYHLFPAGHPVFYKKGRVKTGMIYMEYVHHRKIAYCLSPAVMNEHKDAWHLIDKTFKEISELLKAGKYEPKMVVQPMDTQPRLFDLVA